MPLPVQEHHPNPTLTHRADTPVRPFQRVRVLPLLEQPPSRPHRLDSVTANTTGRLHDSQYEAAVTAAVEGQTDGET